MEFNFTEKEIKQLKEYENIDIVSDKYYFYALRYEDGSVRFIVSYINNDDNYNKTKHYERLDVFNRGEETDIIYQTEIIDSPITHRIKNKTPVQRGDGVYRISFKYPIFISFIKKIKYRILSKIKRD